MARKTILDRFHEKIGLNPNTGCWEWLGSRDAAGYGRLRVNNFNCLAHRVSYQLFVGDVYEELVIHHRCENKGCVNPEHLEQITKQENTTWGAAYNRNLTHCKRGHEFTELNTYIASNGARVCVTCKNAHYLANKDKQILRAKWRQILRAQGADEYTINQFIKDLEYGRE